jgi:HSP20 family protein
MAIMKKQNQKELETRVIQPLVNIREEQGEIILEAEMAGLSKEDISLDINGDEIVLRARPGRVDDDLPKGYTVIHKERCPLEYLRTFILGNDIDKNKIDAQYDKGVLRVKLAKIEEAQPKKIEIKDQ